MANQRLSRLQKWILTQCYQKTILKDVSEFKILDAYKFQKRNKHYFSYLFRAEILLNYWNCESNNDKFTLQRYHHFRGNSNKAQVSTTRSINTLEKNGLIIIREGLYIRWQGIKLTEKGIEKSLMLMNH